MAIVITLARISSRLADARVQSRPDDSAEFYGKILVEVTLEHTCSVARGIGEWADAEQTSVTLSVISETIPVTMEFWDCSPINPPNIHQLTKREIWLKGLQLRQLLAHQATDAACYLVVSCIDTAAAEIARPSGTPLVLSASGPTSSPITRATAASTSLLLHSSLRLFPPWIWEISTLEGREVKARDLSGDMFDGSLREEDLPRIRYTLEISWHQMHIEELNGILDDLPNDQGTSVLSEVPFLTAKPDEGVANVPDTDEVWAFR